MDIGSIIKAIENSHGGRIFWRIIVVVLILFLGGVFWVGFNSKKNLELFGIKIKNQDTVYITKHDTIYKDRNVSTPVKSSEVKISQKSKEGTQQAIGRDNNGIQAGNGSINHQVSGNGNHDIINGDVTIGESPPHPDPSILQMVKSRYPNLNQKLKILRNTNERFSKEFCDALLKLMTDGGYKNAFIELMIADSPPTEQAVRIYEEDGMITLYVDLDGVKMK